MRKPFTSRPAFIVALAIALVVIARVTEPAASRLLVTEVQAIGMTVSNADRASEFYARVLSFRKISDVEFSGQPYELLERVPGARARVVRMLLGDETIELTEYRAPHGRPFPADTRSNDRWFQHVAIIVASMDRAYTRLLENHVDGASVAPQRLPDWNPQAGGIRAFYFRDPDRHFLEILRFPEGKGDAKWHRRSERLFLGIDHTAIVVADTEASVAFYRDVLGMRIAGESDNYGIEQERLNNVPGAHLRITTLRPTRGPGVELLQYLAPRDGKPAPADLRANDIAHWETTMSVEPLEPTSGSALPAVSTSADVAGVPAHALGFERATLVHDPDGHAVRLVEPVRK